jgi:hypothetical protein
VQTLRELQKSALDDSKQDAVDLERTRDGFWKYVWL